MNFSIFLMFSITLFRLVSHYARIMINQEKASLIESLTQIDYKSCKEIKYIVKMFVSIR